MSRIYRGVQSITPQSTAYTQEGTAVPSEGGGGGGGGGGTTNYNDLVNKPRINNIVLAGNKTAADLGVATATDLINKADKVPSAISNHLAGLNSTGNLIDSGIASTDVAMQSAVYLKTDKVAGATAGNFAGLSATGNLTDSGYTASSFATPADVSVKADKVTSAVAGNFAGLDSAGNLTDSGLNNDDFSHKAVVAPQTLNIPRLIQLVNPVAVPAGTPISTNFTPTDIQALVAQLPAADATNAQQGILFKFSNGLTFGIYRARPNTFRITFSPRDGASTTMIYSGATDGSATINNINTVLDDLIISQPTYTMRGTATAQNILDSNINNCLLIGIAGGIVDFADAYGPITSDALALRVYAENTNATAVYAQVTADTTAANVNSLRDSKNKHWWCNTAISTDLRNIDTSNPTNTMSSWYSPSMSGVGTMNGPAISDLLFLKSSDASLAGITFVHRVTAISGNATTASISSIWTGISTTEDNKFVKISSTVVQEIESDLALRKGYQLLGIKINSQACSLIAIGDYVTRNADSKYMGRLQGIAHSTADLAADSTLFDGQPTNKVLIDDDGELWFYEVSAWVNNPSADYTISEQIEVGSESEHININSIDRPTIEMPAGKYGVAYNEDVLVLQQLVNNIQNLGLYLGRYPTHAALPTNISGYAPKIPTLSDFVYVSVDETQNNNEVRYIVQAIDVSTGDITYDSGYIVTQDMSGKVDVVPTATEDNFATFDATGNIKDSGFDASDFALATDLTNKVDTTVTMGDSTTYVTNAGTQVLLRYTHATSGNGSNVRLSSSSVTLAQGATGKLCVLSVTPDDVLLSQLQGTRATLTNESVMTLADVNAAIANLPAVAMFITLPTSDFWDSSGTLTAAELALINSSTGCVGIISNADFYYVIGNSTATMTVMKLDITSGQAQVRAITKSTGDWTGYFTAFVRIDGAQTIAGTKTFSTSPVVPSKTTFPSSPSGTAIATESQISAGITSLAVTLTGNQTVAGTKTFSTSPVVPSKSAVPSSPGATVIATEAQVNAMINARVAALAGWTVATLGGSLSSRTATVPANFLEVKITYQAFSTTAATDSGGLQNIVLSANDVARGAAWGFISGDPLDEWYTARYTISHSGTTLTCALAWKGYQKSGAFNDRASNATYDIIRIEYR